MNIEALTMNEWRDRLGFKSDKELAERFGLSQTTIRYYRSNSVRLADTSEGLKRVSNVGDK